MSTINSNLNTLKERDVYSLLLFCLYKLSDIPEYSSLSELVYVMDKKNFLNFCEYFGGQTIKVPTIDGDVVYTVPAGTQSGTVFRLRGKGVPIVNTKNRGDQYVKVIVDIPKNLNEKQKEALAEFMRACGEEVEGVETTKTHRKFTFGKK